MFYVEADGSYIPWNEVAVDKLHHQNRSNVGWTSYIFYSSLLVVLSPFVGIAKVSLFIRIFFNRKDPQYANIQDRIQKYASLKHQKYSTEDLMDLTQRIHDLVEPKLKHIILDLVAMEKDLSHIHPILQGANVEIIGDKGFFFKAWKANPLAKKRASSHQCDRDKAYGIQGSLFNELLFWKDKKTHYTRFQLESHPARNPLTHFSSCVLHLRDYLNYKRSGLQQGQFGESPFTEDKPIRIIFDNDVFLANKAELEDVLKVTKHSKA